MSAYCYLLNWQLLSAAKAGNGIVQASPDRQRRKADEGAVEKFAETHSLVAA